MAEKKKRRRRRSEIGRMYYGPEGDEKSLYFKCKAKKATKGVVIQGTVAAALKAYKGVSVGCAMSFAAQDDASKFPHPAYLISVSGSTMRVVDALNRDGSPKSFVQYDHGYSRFVEMNDTEALKEHPEEFERPLHLRVPRKRKRVEKTGEGTGGTRRASNVVRHRGVMKRAITAGLIGKHVAEQLTHLIGNAKKQGEATEGPGNSNA